MRNLVFSLLLLGTACVTPIAVEPLSVPLQYKMMAGADDFPKLDSCAGVSDVRITDARTDSTLGLRFAEGTHYEGVPVTTESDVAEWVGAGAREALANGGVAARKAGAPVLKISIDQIRTTENVFMGGGYEAHILISAELTGPNGVACWRDRAEGASANYGHAGRVLNYQELLNHALDRAMIALMNSDEFPEKICGCQEDSGAASAAAPLKGY